MIGQRTIVGIGEALWDIFPDGQRLGGAPLNVAAGAQQLGNAGVVVSRIGQDRLGDALRAELTERNMALDHIQNDPDHATGRADVDVDPSGAPRYRIADDVAWDYLQWDGDLAYLADQCSAVCFGTVAQRDAQTRNTIYRFLGEARGAVRLYDINLRPGTGDRRTLRRSLDLATAAKFSRDEFDTLRRILVLDDEPESAAARLMKSHALDWIALTRGADGTVVYTAAGVCEGEPATAQPVDGADPVGAGDATSAALLHGVVRRWPWERTITLANKLGAHVAGQAGACPELTDELKQLSGQAGQA
jgi:fructokinase